MLDAFLAGVTEPIEFALIIVCKASAVLLLALMLVPLQSRASAAQKHNHLSAALLATLLIPALELIPELQLHILAPETAALPQALSMNPTFPAEGNAVKLASSQLYLLSIYIIGVILSLASVVRGYRLLLRMFRNARLLVDERVTLLIDKSCLQGISVWQIEGLSTPLTFGFFHPRIVVPADFSQAEPDFINAAIRHELAHIRRHDWLLQTVMRCLVALVWFNPLAYCCLGALRQQAELAADDDVVLDGAESTGYALALVSYARQLQQSLRGPERAALALITPALESRVKSILSRRVRQRNDGFRLTETVAVYVLCLLPFTVVQAVPSAPPYAGPPERTGTRINPSPKLAGLIVCGGPEWHKGERLIFSQPPSNRPHTEGANYSPATRDTHDFAKPGLPVSALKVMFNSRVSIFGFMPQRSAMPNYPERALRKGIEGFVVVEFDINPIGFVVNPRVLQSEPGTVFDRAALKAVKQSRYNRQQVGENAVTIRGATNRFVFKIADKDTEDVEPEEPFREPTMIARGEKHAYL